MKKMGFTYAVLGILKKVMYHLLGTEPPHGCTVQYTRVGPS
jgi:hypothetical protein